MRRTTSFVVATLMALSSTGVAVVGQSSDAFIGTWKLNLAKSTYNPGPPPKSNIIKWEPREGGLRLTTLGVDAQGQVTRFEWLGKFDGKDYPIKGVGQTNNLSTTRAYKRVDERTYEGVNKAADGETTFRSRWIVSRDGKTMTQFQTGKNAQAQTVKNTGVWEKQ